jgi:hypothetical protein
MNAIAGTALFVNLAKVGRTHARTGSVAIIRCAIGVHRTGSTGSQAGAPPADTASAAAVGV